MFSDNKAVIRFYQAQYQKITVANQLHNSKAFVWYAIHRLIYFLKITYMKITSLSKLSIIGAVILASCGSPDAPKQNMDANTEKVAHEDDFEWMVDNFADLKIIRYQVPGFDQLSLKQKKLVYYLSQAALSGRDIIWDQNYRHNLKVRRTLEAVVNSYTGDRNSEAFGQFMTYVKRVWFSSGIHHHYSTKKILPEFDFDYFSKLVNNSKGLPLAKGQDAKALLAELKAPMFDPSVDKKRVNLDGKADLVLESANNFYGENVTQNDAEAYYKDMANSYPENATKPLSYGLNSKLVKHNGLVSEQVWKSGGMYGEAIDQIVMWLEKAVTVAETKKQGDALKLLIKYYKTGDLKIWDDYNVAWVEATGTDIDYINGFIEVYGDAKGYKATYESVIQIKDFEASAAMKTLSENTQWFEDNSSIMDKHKKKNVVGVSYKVVNVAMESGDASPSTPIGINLPNANWIRSNHGSKSVSLGNIVYAYSQAGGKGSLEEFCLTEAEVERSKAHGKRASKLHTALHEVVGHASGQINPGIGTPKETLKNYASALEEGRADLVALYYLLDEKMIELGLMESLEVGKAEYDSYIRNGLVSQLQRLEPGDVIEEAHMRNRQMVAGWAYERGQKENVIEMVKQDGKTYYRINDYEKLRVIFGELLREIQRIKSEGDFEAGKNLIENYGVQVDPKLHAEVLERVAKLNNAPYGGFINPSYELVKDADGNITDVKINYPKDFTQQMLGYAKDYSFLPTVN